MKVTRQTHILEILEKCPGAREVFERHGLDCAACFGANVETLEDGALMHDIDVEVLIEELNRGRECDG